MTAQFLIEVILAISILSGPLALLWHRSIAKKADGGSFGIGVRTVQFIGAITVPQAVVILALEGLLDGGTVAALVGTLVGYLFAGLTEFDRRKPDS
jgi:hypothetical protein